MHQAMWTLRLHYYSILLVAEADHNLIYQCPSGQNFTETNQKSLTLWGLQQIAQALVTLSASVMGLGIGLSSVKCHIYV